jgi:hypothetical protein
MKNGSETKSQVRCHSLPALTLLPLVTLPILCLRRFNIFFLHRKIQRYHIIPPITITLLALLPSIKAPLLRLLRRHSIAKQYHLDLFEACTAVQQNRVEIVSHAKRTFLFLVDPGLQTVGMVRMPALGP